MHTNMLRAAGSSAAAVARRTANPRVVAIGGGTGLPNVLRGLRPVLFAEGCDTSVERLIAVVATTDDGGSSGRLRAEFNVIPPGDIRNCLAALSDNDAQIADIFQYRFGAGGGLSGHALGNLVLTALADVTSDFGRAVEIASRLIGARGVVLPATSEVVTLLAEFADGRVTSGETAIAAARGRIMGLSLLPPSPACSPAVVDAIARADVIVAGPGSLFTSILPPLLVPDIAAAVAASRGLRVLVANLMTEPGETDHFTVLDHLLAIERQLGRQLFDCVIYNTMPVPAALAASYAARESAPIVTGTFELTALERLGVQAIGVPLVSEQPADRIRHHPERLASAIYALARRKLSAWRHRSDMGEL